MLAEIVQKGFFEPALGLAEAGRRVRLRCARLATLTPLSAAEARGFLVGYDEPELLGVVPVPAGTVNSSYALLLAGRRRFLRIYEEQDAAGAASEAALLAHLATRGVPTPGPLPRKDGGFVGVLLGKPCVLFPWRDGTMRCLAGVTPEDARRVGHALAEVHVAGEGARLPASRFRPEDLTLRLERIAAFHVRAIAELAPPLSSKLRDVAASRNPALPQGLVHGDLFRDNVLWSGDGNLSALLDFESASHGTLAFDLMVTVLAWCFTGGFDGARARAMTAGYEQVRRLTPAERAALAIEGAFAALRFTITRITDDAMRAARLGVPPRRDKDWRRFATRLHALEALGSEGILDLLGLAP